MKQEFNINLSKILFDLLAINIAFGITNLIIFYTFWVDGWSYPSLFIVTNISTLISFMLCNQGLMNPSFTLKKLMVFSSKYLLIIFLIISVYWIAIHDAKYYLIHLLLFFGFTIIITLLFRLIWTSIFSKLLRRIYTSKNVMIVSENYSSIANTIMQNDWLKYSIEHSVDKINPSDIPLYSKQFDLDILIIDLKIDKNLLEEFKRNSKESNVSCLFLSPNAKGTNLKKIIGNLYLFK